MSTKLSIEEARKIAIKNKGKCLSKEYINSQKLLDFECSKNHFFKMGLSNVKIGHWCPECAGNKKLSINHARDEAKKHGGSCLSDSYLTVASPLLFECSNKHSFNMRLSDVKRGHWCPICAHARIGNLRRLQMEDVLEEVKKHGGSCLSNTYVNNSTSMEFCCKNLHIFKATLNTIKDGHWCPECAINKKLSISDAIRAAKERGGRCLSKHYKNSKTLMRFVCSKGHKFKTSIKSIRAGSWCMACSGKKKHTLLDIINEIEKYNGKCLSKRYKNLKTLMKFKCSKNHEFKMRFSCIKQGQWCPECSHEKSALKVNNKFIKNHWKTGEKLICVASYEAKTVDFWNNNKIDFLWQHKRFQLPTELNIGKTYRPDAYLIQEDKWIEIKGYFWGDSKEKWKWFHKTHKNSELWNKSTLVELGIKVI